MWFICSCSCTRVPIPVPWPVHTYIPVKVTLEMCGRVHLDHETVGNLWRSVEEKLPFTTWRFHANGTSAGRGLLSNSLHPASPLSLRDGLPDWMSCGRHGTDATVSKQRWKQCEPGEDFVCWKLTHCDIWKSTHWSTVFGKWEHCQKSSNPDDVQFSQFSSINYEGRGQFIFLLIK